MRRFTSLVAVSVLAFAVPLLAQKSDPAIDKLTKQYEAAFNKGDAKALAALYTADAFRVAPNGQLVTGRDAIEKQLAEAMAGPAKGGKLTLHQGRVQMPQPDVALVEGTFEVAGAANPLKGRYVNTLVREGGEWRLASVVTIPATPGMK